MCVMHCLVDQARESSAKETCAWNVLIEIVIHLQKDDNQC